MIAHKKTIFALSKQNITVMKKFYLSLAFALLAYNCILAQQAKYVFYFIATAWE